MADPSIFYQGAGSTPDSVPPRGDGTRPSENLTIYHIRPAFALAAAERVERLPETDPEKASGTYEADLTRGVHGVLSRNPFGFYLVGRELTSRSQQVLEHLANELQQVQRRPDIPVPLMKKMVDDACAEGHLVSRPLFVVRGLQFDTMPSKG